MEKEEKGLYDNNYVIALEREISDLRDQKQQLETELAYNDRRKNTGVELLNE